MAKNSAELNSVLEDINDKSGDLLSKAQKYYDEISAN